MNEKVRENEWKRTQNAECGTVAYRTVNGIRTVRITASSVTSAVFLRVLIFSTYYLLRFAVSVPGFCVWTVYTVSWKGAIPLFFCTGVAQRSEVHVLDKISLSEQSETSPYILSTHNSANTSLRESILSLNHGRLEHQWCWKWLKYCQSTRSKNVFIPSATSRSHTAIAPSSNWRATSIQRTS